MIIELRWGNKRDIFIETHIRKESLHEFHVELNYLSAATMKIGLVEGKDCKRKLSYEMFEGWEWQCLHFDKIAYSGCLGYIEASSFKKDILS